WFPASDTLDPVPTLSFPSTTSLDLESAFFALEGENSFFAPGLSSSSFFRTLACTFSSFSSICCCIFFFCSPKLNLLRRDTSQQLLDKGFIGAQGHAVFGISLLDTTDGELFQAGFPLNLCGKDPVIVVLAGFIDNLTVR